MDTPPTRWTSSKTGAGRQLPRSTTTSTESGSTRPRLLANPPPVMCARACTATAPMRAGTDRCRSGWVRAALRPGCARAPRPSVQGPPAPVQQHMADQGVTVRVQSRGGHGHDRITGPDQVGAEQLVPFDHPGRGPRHVVLVGAQETRVLGRLPSDQGTAGLDARLRDPLDDGRDPLGNHLPAGDVVGQEKRLGPTHHEIVDHHAHQVEADGLVPVQCLRDRDLGADPVGGGGQHRMLESGQRGGVEQPGEPAQPAEDFGSLGFADPGLHQVDRAVPGFDVDPGGRVSRRVIIRPGHERFSGVTPAPASVRSWTAQAHGRARASAAPTPATEVANPSTSVRCPFASSSTCLPRRSARGSSIG